MQTAGPISRLMKTTWLLAVLLLTAASPAHGGAMGKAEAGRAASGWLGLNGRLRSAARPGGPSEAVRTFTDDDGGVLYHVFYPAGGGFVVVSADDRVEPIVAFADHGRFDPAPTDPLGALVAKDMTRRLADVRAARHGRRFSPPGGSGRLRRSDPATKWHRLGVAGTGGSSDLSMYYSDVPDTSTALGDICVEPLLETMWGQGSVCDRYCYNYYTPGHYPAGCIATALAQIMRYYRWPDAPAVAGPFAITVDGQVLSVLLRGGDGLGGGYEWFQMPASPGCETVESHLQAIGAICHDAGVAAQTRYLPTVSSSTYTNARNALLHAFDYGNSLIATSWFQGANASIDAGCPILLGIKAQGVPVEHAVICDGYGYDGEGTIYHHINMGWGGASDAWYNLPQVQNYDIINATIYNIFPEELGLVISGRVTDIDGAVAVVGAVVSLQSDQGEAYHVVTGQHGVYAVTGLPAQTSFTVAVSKAGWSFTPSRIAVTGNPASTYSTSGNVWGVDFQGAAGLHPVMEIDRRFFEFYVRPGDPDPQPQVFSIRNAGFGQLAWNVVHDCNWLEVTPASGISDGQYTDVELGITDLVPGRYYCEMLVEDPAAINSPQTVIVSLLVGGSVFDLPSEDFETIDQAMEAALDGDTIILQPGTYLGQGNCDVSFVGKAVTIRSADPWDPSVVASTIIDCQGSQTEPHRAFFLHNGEGPGSVIDGLTIRGGYVSGSGGAISCGNSSPVISRCNLQGNTAGKGGAVYCGPGGNPVITDCNIAGNTASSVGGAVACEGSGVNLTRCILVGNSAYSAGGVMADAGSPQIISCFFGGNTSVNNGGGLYNTNGADTFAANCIFSGNAAGLNGGGVYNTYQSRPQLVNCTFSANRADGSGGGMYNWAASVPQITNCILWLNNDQAGTGYYSQVYDSDDSTSIITYSCASGWIAAIGGEGNTGLGPDFVEDDGPDNLPGTPDDDLRLISGSPCIDSGLNVAVPAFLTTDIVGGPRILGQAVDMGACEGASQAIVVQPKNMAIDEGATGTFGVNLAGDPGAIVQVLVMWFSGDTDLSVQSCATMTFDSTNYAVQQDVVLAADEDADNFNGSAVFHISSTGLTTVAVAVTELDNEPNPNTLLVDDDAPGTAGAFYGMLWSDPMPDLQAALALAREHPEVERIKVAEGVYYTVDPADADPEAFFELADGLEVIGGYAGYGRPDPEARDIYAYRTILSGDLGEVKSNHVVVGSGTGQTAVLDGFTITGGGGYSGAGMYNHSGSPTVVDCTFRENNSTGSGGGVYNYIRSSPTFIRCRFVNNSSGVGGGIYNYYSSNPVFDSCGFYDNSATRGGAMANEYSSNPVLSQCLFDDNTALEGGAVYADYSKDAIFQRCAFSGNNADKGGALYCNYYSSSLFTRCSFLGNHADLDGGAVYSIQSSPVFRACTFSGNSAVGGGGGINNTNGKSGFVIENCTFSGNTAAAGGAVYNSSYHRPLLVNSILWGDSASEGEEIYLAYRSATHPSGIEVSYCDVAGGAQGVYVGEASVLDWRPGNLDVDPQFADPDAGDYHLKSAGWRWNSERSTWVWDSITSSCIDAGSPGWPMAGEPMSVTGDEQNQWGLNLRINMGAYGGTEEASMAPPGWVLLADLDNDGTVNSGDLELLTAYWLFSNYQWPADLDRSGLVDLPDYCLLAGEWFKSTSR